MSRSHTRTNQTLPCCPCGSPIPVPSQSTICPLLSDRATVRHSTHRVRERQLSAPPLARCGTAIDKPRATERDRGTAHSARNTAFGAAQSRARALARLLVAGCGGSSLGRVCLGARAQQTAGCLEMCTGCRVEALIQYDLSMNMSIAVVNAGWSTNKASVTVKGEIS